MIEHNDIAITRIISAACRDFMAFRGYHNFEFKDGINSIVGGNASGKSSLISLIRQALSPHISSHRGSRWGGDYAGTSLIELKFIARGKVHYLRRVVESSDHTTDLHLYIGEGADIEFLRDGEVVTYLSKLKPVLVFDDFQSSRREFFYRLDGNSIAANPPFQTTSIEMIDGVNKLLPIINSPVTKIVKSGNDVMAEYEGRMVHLNTLSGGQIKSIYVLSKILTLLSGMKERDLSKVILIDEMEMGLDRSTIKGLNEAIKQIAKEHDCQFMMTSRFVNGRVNPITVNRFRVPNYYRSQTAPGNSKSITSLIRKYINQVNIKWKP